MSLKYTNVVKSPSDCREYRAFTLENGMKVLVTSEPNCEKSAASISVGVGSMNDPAEIPGLAHLCEHMLFFESLNNESEISKGYAKFISENGGGCNAFTTRDQTNYHFDVASQTLMEALKRFSKFFTNDPAFPEIALQKEISVINSEHENKMLNDAWRKMAVESFTAKTSHPFCHFSTGNEVTLWKIPKENQINTLEQLKIFYRQYYSANIMSLVILGRESLDELEKIAVSLFSEVKNLNIPIPIWTEHPYGPEECQKRIDIAPITDVRDLYICFSIPDTRPFYKTFPHGYLSNLLGHKGPGSLFAFLNQKNWVNNNYINSSVPARGFGYFAIGLQLTIEGLEYIEEIIGYVFEYIQMLREEGPQKYFWNEMRRILEIQFRFQDRENPIEFVQRTSNLLHVYPLSKVLSVGYILEEFDEFVIKQFLECLIPEKCRIITIARRNEEIATSVEKWYGVKYKLSSIPPETIKAWNTPPIKPNTFKLPPANDFIPSSFNLKPRSKLENESSPCKLHEDDFEIVWFLQDEELLVPKAFVQVEIFSPLPMVDPMGYNLNNLMCTTIKELLIEEFYGAVLTGLNYTVKGTMYGITINGFDEKVPLLAERIFESIVNFQPLLSRFKGIKDAYENGLSNWANQQPYIQVPYYLSLLLREKRFSNEELLKASNQLTMEMLENYHKLFLTKLKLEWFIHGNLTKSEALESTTNCRRSFERIGTLPLSACQTLRFREVDLLPGIPFVFESELYNHRSSCCAVLLQVGVRNLQDNILLELLDQIMYEPCFNQLRNKEHLGYIVRSSIRKSSGTQGLLLIVQGTQQHPENVQVRIDAFFSSLKDIIKSINQEELHKHKTALILRKKDTLKNRSVRARRLWNEEIYTREYDFNRVTEELNYLSSVTTVQLLSFFQKHIDPASDDRKCIRLYLCLPKTNDISENSTTKLNSTKCIQIKKITEWKTQMGLCPLFRYN